MMAFTRRVALLLLFAVALVGPFASLPAAAQATPGEQLGALVPQLTIPQAAVANPNRTFVYEGFIADLFCVRQRWALDGADMLKRPSQHTVHCLVDIARCVDSGFCLLDKDADGSYGCAYVFTDAETRAMVAHFNVDRVERADLFVRFNATWNVTSGRMIPNIASITYVRAAASMTPITVIIVLAVVLALIQGGIGAFMSYKGWRLTPSGETAARIAVVITQLLAVVAIVVVSAVTFVSADIASPVPRAFGVAISYLFLLILLPTTKFLNVAYLVGSSYEQFIKFHVLIGITLWLVMSAHGIGMFIVFADVEPNGGFLFRFTDSRKANGAGFVCWVLLTVMFVTGLLRSFFYTAFRVMHLLFILVLIFAVLHHLLAAVFIVIPLVLYLIDVALRYVRSARASPVVTDAEYIDGARTLKVAMQLQSPWDAESTIGRHVLVGFSGVSAIATHPFTLAWYDVATQTATLFIRNTGAKTWTESAGLAVAAANPGRIMTAADEDASPKEQGPSPTAGALGKVSLGGPYGALSVPLREVGHGLVVAGGIGVTFLMNVLNAVSNAAAEACVTPGAFGRQFPHLQRLSLLWSVREAELVIAVAPYIAGAMSKLAAFFDKPRSDTHAPHHVEVSLRIFVTKGGLPSLPPMQFVSVSAGRPNIPAVLGDLGVANSGSCATCDAPSPTKTCIYGCGPGPILDACAETAALHGVLYDVQAFSIGPPPPGGNAPAKSA